MIARQFLVTALIFAILSIFAAGSIAARELVGTGFVQNKIVQLFDDGTWEFLAKPLPAGCKIVDPKVQFCDEDRTWRKAGGPSYEFDVIYTDGGDIYAGIISEDVGTDAGISEEYMISIALDGAADVSQVATEEVPVHSVEPDEIDGISGQRVVYGSLDKGVRFVFANTIIVRQGLTLQTLSWKLGSEFTDDHRKMHENFIDRIRITYKDPAE